MRLTPISLITREQLTKHHNTEHLTEEKIKEFIETRLRKLNAGITD